MVINPKSPEIRLTKTQKYRICQRANGKRPIYKYVPIIYHEALLEILNNEARIKKIVETYKEEIRANN